MTTSPQPPVFEAEALLRLLFAENGSTEDLIVALDAMAQDAAEMYEHVVVINTGYLDGQHPFPERIHLSALFATFQLELFDVMVKWVEFAKTEITTWPSTGGLGMTDRTEAILNGIKERQSVLGQPYETRRPEGRPGPQGLKASHKSQASLRSPVWLALPNRVERRDTSGGSSGILCGDNESADEPIDVGLTEPIGDRP